MPKMGPMLVKLALFAAITVLLTGYLTLKIEKFSTTDRYELKAEFADITGLFPKDSVKLAGVVVGQVSSIKLRSPEECKDLEAKDKDAKCTPGSALVTFAIDKKFPMPRDSQVIIRWRNLIGQRFLFVVAGTSDELFEDGQTVPPKQTKGTVDLGQLINALGPLGRAINPQQLNDIFEALNGALEGNVPAVTNLVKSLNNVVASLADRSTTINQIVDDYNVITGTLAKRDQQIGTVVENLLSIAQAVNDNTALVESALGNFAAFSANLDRILSGNEQALSQTLDNLSVITDTAVARLPDLEQALVNLPPGLQALFTVVREGEFVRVNLTCLDSNPAPCDTTPVVAASAPPSGMVMPLESAEDFRLALAGAL